MVEKITNMRLRIIDLFRTDYLASFHIRKFSRLLNVSHVTLISYLSKLEDDKILKSEIIGKSKVFKLNFENNLVKDYLIIAEKFEKNRVLRKNFLIKKINDQIFDLNLKSSIILFGSYSKGSETEESDIDLFVLEPSSDRELDKIKEVGEIYGKTINIKKSTENQFKQILSEGNSLIKEIISSHVILQNPDMFVNGLWRFYSEIGR